MNAYNQPGPRAGHRGWCRSLLLPAGAMLVLLPAIVRAVPWVYDGFDYVADTSIAGQNGGTGWSSAWDTGTASGLATNLSGSMSYTDGNGRALAQSGGRLRVGNPLGSTSTTARPSRALPMNLSGGAGTTAGPGATTWISFLYQRQNLVPNPYLRQANLGLFEGVSGERVAVGGPNTSDTVANVLSAWGNGGAHSGADPFQTLDAPITDGSTYFVLLKVITDGTAAPDTAYIWFNWTDLELEPDIGTADIAQDEINLSSVNTLRFQAGNANANGNNAVFAVDELRVGTAFADVAPSVLGPAAPSINTQPADRTVTAGEPAAFRVSAGGEPPLSYQWVRDPDVLLPDQTNATLNLPSAQTNDARGYYVIVSNAVGSVTSVVAALTVLPPTPPVITTQPSGRTVIAGEPVSFSVAATGHAPLRYQWVANDSTPLIQATNATFSLASARTNDAGGYAVIIRNSLGTVTSAVANLTVIYVGPAGLPAFPGADGAAREVTGGRGGLVYHVTTLDRNASHDAPGTLRYGLTHGNFPAGVPRTLVFDVGGVFWLGRFGAESDHDNGWDTGSRYNLPGNITLAGQTAPGPVLIMGGVTKVGGGNILIRNLTFAPGYGMRGFHEPPVAPTPGTFPDAYVYDALDVSGQNVMIDHCTTVYATDETISCNEEADRLTIQYCNISQGQNYPQADAEATGIRYTGHALGSLLQAGSEARVSVLHNLYAQQKGRLPRVGTEASKLAMPGIGAINDFRNNVFYNWFNTAGTGAGGQPSQNNFVRNFYLAGPGGDDPVGGPNSTLITRAGGVNIFNGYDSSLTRVYRSGNLKDTNRDGDLHDPVSADASFVSIAPQPAAYDTQPGVTLDAAAALTNVLLHVGSRWWVREYDFTRDNTHAIPGGDVAATVDERLIHETATGTGRIMAWADDPFDPDPMEGTEWRALLALRADPATGAAPFTRPPGWDSDGDGMPDAWELDHGLDPFAADSNGDFDRDGYTDLEEYMNELAAWPAPGVIEFSGDAGPRYADIFNWRVTGEPIMLAGTGMVSTSSPWQPSRYDTVHIRGRTVQVDAAGQHAGRVSLMNRAALLLTEGWLKVAEHLAVDADSTLAVNEGAGLTVHTLQNQGTVRLTGSAALTMSGIFTNQGVLDIMTWNGTLPPELVNTGTILGPGWIQIGETEVSGADVSVTLHGYSGHAYQLQYSEQAVDGEWLDVGPATVGSNAPARLVHAGGATAGERYYRVAVNP